MRASPSTCRVLAIDWEVRGLCLCLCLAHVKVPESVCDHSQGLLLPSRHREWNIEFRVLWQQTNKQTSEPLTTIQAYLAQKLRKRAEKNALVLHNLSLFTTSLRIRVMISRVWTKSQHTSIQAYKTCSTSLLPLPFSTSPHHLRIQQTNKDRLCQYFFKGSDSPKNCGSGLKRMR